MKPQWDARASGTICGRAAELRRAAKIYGWTANGAYADRIMTKIFLQVLDLRGAPLSRRWRLVCAAAFPAARAEALTQAEAAPVVFEALGRETPEKFLTAVEGDMTRRDALRFAFEAMGWGFALAAVDQIGILPEWAGGGGCFVHFCDDEPAAARGYDGGARRVADARGYGRL